MQADSLNNKQQAATRAASANAGQPPEAAPRQTTFEHQQQQQQQWLPEQKPSVCFDTTVSGQHAGVASRAAAVLAASPTAGGQLQPHQFSLTPAATSGRTASGGEVFMQQQQQQVTLSPRSSSTSSFPVGPGSVWQPYNFPQSVHEQDSASKHLSPQHSMEFGATAAAKMAGPALPVQQQQIQQQQQVQVQQQQQQQLQLPQQHYQQQQQQQQQQQPAPNQQATSPVVIPQQGYRSHGPAQVVSGSPGGARSPGGRSPRQPPSRLPSFQRASIKEEFSDDDDDSSDEDDRLSLAASRQSQVMSRRGGSAVGADSFVAPGSHASRPLSPRAASPSGVGLHYTVSAEAASRASQAPSLRAEGSVVEDLGAVASAAASFNVGLEASAAVAAAAQQHPPQQQQQPGAGRGKEGAAVAAAGGSGGGKQEEGDALQQEFQNLALFDDDDDDEDLDAPEKRVWYKRPLVWLHVMAFVLALVLFVVGLCSQFLVTSWQSTSTNESIQLHRWMYFFSLWPLLWVCVVALNNRVFRFVEWLFYREALYYLDSVRRTARNLLFMGLILAWHEIIFRLAWCEDRCSAASSDKAVNRLWKVMLCTFFFTMANFLKAMLTKFMSTHFYRTAHFKKVKQAIEKEYYLMMLSQPRPHKLEPEPLSLNHTASIFGTVLKRRVTGEPGAWGSPSHAGGLGSPSADGRPGHYKSWSLDLTEPSFAQGGLRSLATRSLTMFKAYGGHNSLEMTAAGPEGQRPAHPVRSRSAAQLQTPEARSATLQSAHEGNEVPAAAPPQVPGIGQPPAGGEEQPPWDGAGAPLPGLDVLQPPLVTVQATAEGGPAPGCLWSRRRGHGDHYQQPQQQPSPSTCPSERRGLLRSTSSPWVPSTPPPPGAAGGPAVSTMGLKVIHEGQPSVTSPTGPGSAPSGRSGSFVRPSGGSMTAAATPAAAAAGGGAAAKPSTAASLLKAASGRLRRSSHADEAAANGDKAAAGSGAPPVTRTASGIARKVSGSAGGPGIGMASAAHAGADDPLLQPEVLETVNIRVRGEKVKLSNISTAEWERLRTGIALKTFTALMTRYQAMSEAEEERKLKEARRFAKGLFFNIKEDPDRTFLIRSDFDVFFTSRDMADQAFRYFDKDNDQRLSLREMKDSVVAIFKERKNMASSLKDTDSIVHTLEFGIGCVFHFLFFAVYLLVWNVDIMKGFDTFSATVLALTFVFGNSVRQIYESMLFLFVEHAFDVGDLLEVEGMQYRVKKIDLMYTLMVKSTGEHSYYPNTRLITLPVLNLTRATGRTDKVVFSLDVGRGGAAARAALMAALKKHHEVNGSDFSSCPSVNYVGLLDPFKVQIQVAWTYSFGPDDIKRAASVKTALLSEVHQCLGSLPLEYTYAQHGDEDERHTAGSSPGPGAGAAPAPGAQQGLRPDTGMPFLFGPPAPAAPPPAVAPK